MRQGALTQARQGSTLDDAFAAAMARMAPFEAAPHLAVAVSGGSDSVALALLAAVWADVHGGRITALTVDHRLREGSAAEAAQVSAWMAARGVEHQTLCREGPLPPGNVQAAAREARYALLGNWCREHGVLHLLVGHQAEDQAETLLLRLARGSGLDGLAAIPALIELPHCRVLRPLLAVRREGLVAWLEALRQPFLSDPGNETPRFARNRLRAALGAEGLSTARLVATARNLGRARAALERQIERLLAECAVLDPAGFALVDPRALAATPQEVQLRALASLVTTIGARPHAPRLERLERAAAALDVPRTLAGCRLLPWRGRLLVCREAASCAPPVALRAGSDTRWDRRFIARLRDGAPTGLFVAAAGKGVPGDLPGAIKEALPAVFDLEGLVEVPHLGYSRAGSETILKTFAWRPLKGLTPAGFTVA